ncbi:MAG TPA: ribonuclease R [Symbiobacteriaceae bacterium]|nr:ribonuclease R [Symbiobacteriaceae bacterium]
MKERIAKFIREKAYKPMTFDELCSAMGVAEKQYTQLQKTLEQMEAAGEVVKTRVERYGAPERMNLAVGRLQGHPKGFGFLVQDAPDAEDIFIGRESLNGAMHGDRIIARLSPPARIGARVEGEVIRILQRGNQRIVGTFDTSKHAGYVTPDDKRLTEDIFIPKGATNGAKNGEKVVVQIVQYPDARRVAEGKIVERIGMKGAVGVDIVSVIRKYGLPEIFPPKVLKDAETVPDTVQEEAIREEGRRDLRGWTIVTIDGEDAKDLDDAVNVERIGENLWRLGVHIADVAYYVQEGSSLDREAYVRATSVYLADRVVPMLPPKLSNGICSLNPAVDRLTLSCVMELNGEGKVLKYEIFPSVIKTAARMTYTKVNKILGGDQELIREYQPLVPMFREMLSLMEILRTKRGRRGALDFDLPEAKVKLNEQGWPLEIRRVERGVAERIIEEFMLVANETVAEHCYRHEVPFMYRVHGEPNTDRLAGLRDFLALFGYSLKLSSEGGVSPKVLQEITDFFRGRPEENLVNQVLLRTMRQAIYSDENLGHFGLAAEFYCHFTSPIRRYPDLVVHRVLRIMFTGQVNKKKHKLEQWLPSAAQHSSERERLAMEAERETIDLKKAEFMSDKVGQTFAGIISGVGQFGFFVSLPSTVEGLVHVSTLDDDYYHFHENYYALIGERTRRRFRLGDPVVVRLMRVDIDNRQMDFALEAKESPVVTVESVPGETRGRAPKKRALMGLPVAAEQPAEREDGRNKKKRRKGRKGGRPDAEAASLAAVETVTAAPLERPRKPVHRVVTVEPKAEPERAPRPAREEAPRERTRPAARETREPRETRELREPREPRETPAPRATGRGHARSTKVDMWGVSVPEGKARPRIEDDPSVTNPYSLTPVPREGRRSSRTTAFTEAPFAPSPGTADESAGLPATPDGAVLKRPSRGRRTQQRPRRRPQAGDEE